MVTDVFNNSSNDYVYPALSPCAGVADDSNLELTKDGIGIISGSDILSKIDLSNLSIAISSYSTEIKILREREVTYVPGLTKGLQQRQQGFLFPYLVSDDETKNPYFFQVDLSINYYKNFRFQNKNIEASADNSTGINIIDALNIKFGDLDLDITASMDSSALIFTGNLDGFDFSISNVILGIIDASMNSESIFPHEANLPSYILEEGENYDIPYAKYPNGAMQGIIMRGIYPKSTPQTPYDKWLFINHVTDYVTVYEPIQIQNYLNEIQITFDPSITFGPFIDDASEYADYYEEPIPPGTYPDILAIDCSIYGSDISDSSIWDCSIGYTDFSNSVIENSRINQFMVDPSERSIIDQNSIINNSLVWNSSIYDCSIYNSTLYYVGIERCTLYNCETELTTLDSSSRVIRINEDVSIINTPMDPSTYYEKFVKRLDVGLNGSSSETIMSAGDYLDWVTTNNEWRKFGDLYAWTSAADGCVDCRNLIDGFYVYNPHPFDIKIEYMIFI